MEKSFFVEVAEAEIAALDEALTELHMALESDSFNDTQRIFMRARMDAYRASSLAWQDAIKRIG